MSPPTYSAIAPSQAGAGQAADQSPTRSMSSADRLAGGPAGMLSTAGHRRRDGRDGQGEITTAQAGLDRLLAELQAALLPRDRTMPAMRSSDPCRHRGESQPCLPPTWPSPSPALLRAPGWHRGDEQDQNGDLGGLKELVLRIEGRWGARQLKFGSWPPGAVPETESQGRIHTSARTVAVMPEPDEPPGDPQPAAVAHRHLPRQRAGGQHINKDRLGVRITTCHQPRRRVRCGRPVAASATRPRPWRRCWPGCGRQGRVGHRGPVKRATRKTSSVRRPLRPYPHLRSSCRVGHRPPHQSRCAGWGPSWRATWGMVAALKAAQQPGSTRRARRLGP